jgi:hypothetical protein
MAFVPDRYLAAAASVEDGVPWGSAVTAVAAAAGLLFPDAC